MQRVALNVGSASAEQSLRDSASWSLAEALSFLVLLDILRAWGTELSDVTTFEVPHEQSGPAQGDSLGANALAREASRNLLCHAAMCS